MLHKMSTIFLALLLATSSQVAMAVEASDVVCDKCVENSDVALGTITRNRLSNQAVSTAKLQNDAVTTVKIADGAVNGAKLQDNTVTSEKIKNGAVTTTKIAGGAINEYKIANGAVTADKLDPAILAAIGALTTTYDMPAVTATQQVYALSGDFTTSGGATICQTTGSDTEVRDIVRTDLGGGITQVVMTRQRFASGTGGTPCHYNVITLINDGSSLQIVERENYNNTGTTLNRTDSTEYHPSSCSDCGIIQRQNDMTVVVKPVLWGGKSERDTVMPASVTVGVYLGRTTLVDANFSKTVTAGTFNNCNEYAQERASEHFGYFANTSVVCPAVGRVYTSRINKNTDGGVTSQIWELTSYTAP